MSALLASLLPLLVAGQDPELDLCFDVDSPQGFWLTARVRRAGDSQPRPLPASLELLIIEHGKLVKLGPSDFLTLFRVDGLDLPRGWTVDLLPLRPAFRELGIRRMHLFVRIQGPVEVALASGTHFIPRTDGEMALQTTIHLDSDAPSPRLIVTPTWRPLVLPMGILVAASVLGSITLLRVRLTQAPPQAEAGAWRFRAARASRRLYWLSILIVLGVDSLTSISSDLAAMLQWGPKATPVKIVILVAALLINSIWSHWAWSVVEARTRDARTTWVRFMIRVGWLPMGAASVLGPIWLTSPYLRGLDPVLQAFASAGILMGSAALIWTLASMVLAWIRHGEAHRAWIDRIRQVAATAKVALHDVVILDLRREKLAIAAVTGLGRKKLLISDYLLDHLPEDEVFAVLWHEFGHLRGGHIVRRWVLLGALMFLGSLLIGFAAVMPVPEGWSAAWFVGPVLFGLIALRVVRASWHAQELAADEFAVRHAPVPGAIGAALRRIEELNGALPIGRLTHPATAMRVRRIEELARTQVG